MRGKRIKTTYRAAMMQAAPDLVGRNFTSQQPDRLWVADITYVRSREDFIYLAFILDVCRRRVVGWSMATHLKTELVVDALEMAIARGKPAPGLVHHIPITESSTLPSPLESTLRAEGSYNRWVR
jgi:putative transposase